MKRTGNKIIAACAAAALAVTLALPAAFGAEGTAAQAPGAAEQSAGAPGGAAAAPAEPDGAGAAAGAAGQEGLGAAGAGQEGAADEADASKAAAAEGAAALEAQAPAADAAAARVSPVRVSLKANLGRLEAPYGADIEEWLADQDIFDVRPGLDGAALRALFAGGKPLKVMGSGGSSYPGPGSSIVLTWGTVLDPILSPVSTDGSSLRNIALTMGKVEPWLLDGVDLGEPAEDSQARLTTDGRTTRLWLNSGATLDGRFDRTAGFEFVMRAPSVPTEPEPGDFSRATPVLRLPATNVYPQEVYARVDGDWTFNQGTPEERRLAQGQIVKLPLVCLDQTPGVLESDARMSAGNEVGGVLYAQKGTVLTLDVEDQDDPSLPAGGNSDRVSGISKAVLKHNGVVLAEAVPVPASPHPRVSFVLDVPGAYDVADLNVELVDFAGNKAPYPLPTVVDAAGNPYASSITALQIVADVPTVSVTYQGASNPWGCYQTRTALVQVRDPHFGALSTWYAGLTPAQADALDAVVTFQNVSDPASTVEVDLGQLVAGGGRATAVLSGDGQYEVQDAAANPAYEGVVPGLGSAWDAGSDLAPFKLDTCIPVGGRVELSAEGLPAGGWLFYPGATTIEMRLSDELSGVDPGSIGLTFDGAVQGIEVREAGPLGSTLVWNVPSDAGFVDFSLVEISFSDRAGNRAAPVNLGAHPLKNIEADGVYASDAQPLLAVAFDNEDVRHGKYYNAHRTATVTIEDAAFGFVRASEPEREVATLHHDGERLVAARDFERSEDDPNVWAAQVPCTDEGTFSLEARYTSPTGLEAESYQGEEFVVDTVAPRIESVTLSPERTQLWGVLFAADAGQAAFVLADDTSGVDEAAVFLSEGGEPQALPCSTDENLVTTAFWDVSARNGLIPLSAVSLSLADKAGNPAALDGLDGFENRNLEEVHGLFVDTAAPEIAVSFDNNDVRNGKYYNAGRTATVTVTEASFAFVRDNDPRRTVAVLHRDGSAREVRAEEFENPSGDGVTWVVAVPCEDDGAYRLDVDFADPSGKQAPSYRGGEFVVDKTAPLIMLTFDNEESQGGGYFKAPRTATVTVYEENFSADLASISTTAADAAGNAAGAPGASAWAQTAETWQASVYFGEELHYTLEAACTDLAGNAAEAVSEPEFVIDLTAPSVRIERVADRSAYKDEVAPLVFFEDVNFEPYLAEVSIVGTNRGDGLYFRSEEALTETTRTVDFADFDYKLENDDVYTLTATVRDRAGNEVSQQVTFSVNRFGSNYRLSDETRALMGTFVKKGQDVVVTETNVSGLAASSVSVVRNDEVRRLVEGVDYRMEAVGDQTSWSQYTYTLPASLFQEDGYYRVLLSSLDVAGSLSENLMEGKNEDRTDALEMAFAVDGTSPQASIGGVEGATAYYAPAQGVQLYAADNLEAESAELFVNGAQVASWDADQLAGTDPLGYDLPALDGARSVRLEVRDRAGNTTAVSADGIVVTNDLVRYVLESPAILYPIVAALIVVSGAALMMAARAMERRRQSGQDR